MKKPNWLDSSGVSTELPEKNVFGDAWKYMLKNVCHMIWSNLSPGGGVLVAEKAFQPICSKLRFCLLNRIVFSY